MAFFNIRQWLDRISEHPNRRTLTNVEDPTDVKTYDLSRAEGDVSVQGTALTGANLTDLENRIGAAFTAVENAMPKANPAETPTASLTKLKVGGTVYEIEGGGGEPQTGTIENVAIASFSDGADGVPVSELIVDIKARQEGSGTPSPDNVRAISGFDSGVVSVCGVNIWNEQWELGTFFNGHLIPSTTRIRNKYPIPVKPNTTYYLKSPAVACYVMQVDKDSNWTQYYSAQVNLTFTTKPWAKYIYFTTVETYGTTYNNDISINYPSSDTQYHSYVGNTYTVDFGQTVYGGHFDNRGNLVVTHGYIASYNGETINEPWISSMDNYTPNTSPSTGAQVVYPLTTPTALTITSENVKTLLGNNNIFANTGNIEKLVYFKTGCENIAKLIEAMIQ